MSFLPPGSTPPPPGLGIPTSYSPSQQPPPPGLGFPPNNGNNPGHPPLPLHSHHHPHSSQIPLHQPSPLSRGFSSASSSSNHPQQNLHTIGSSTSSSAMFNQQFPPLDSSLNPNSNFGPVPPGIGGPLSTSPSTTRGGGGPNLPIGGGGSSSGSGGIGIGGPSSSTSPPLPMPMSISILSGLGGGGGGGGGGGSGGGFGSGSGSILPTGGNGGGIIPGSATLDAIANVAFTTSGALVESVDKKIMVHLRDGKKLIGVLRSYDQYANLVLQDTIERIHHEASKTYGERNQEVILVRGENVVMLGEVDLDLEDPTLHSLTRVPFKEISKRHQEDFEALCRNRKKIEKRLWVERGFMSEGAEGDAYQIVPTG